MSSTQLATNSRQPSENIADRGWRLDRRQQPRPSVCQVSPYAQQDEPVASLWNAETFGFDQEVVRLELEELIRSRQRSDLVGEALRRCCEVVEDPREHRSAAVVRRQKALHVLQHENRWCMDPQDPEVFAIEEVLLVGLEVLVVGSTGAARQRIRLARWPADQHPARRVCQGSSYARVDARRTYLAKLRVQDLALGFHRSMPNRIERIELFTRHLSAKQFVIASQLAGIGELPAYCPEPQGLASDLVLLNGESDLEGAATPSV